MLFLHLRKQLHHGLFNASTPLSNPTSTTDYTQLHVWSKALSHPARIIILNYLMHNGTTSFNEIRKIIPLAPTTVSQHLKYLGQSGLIEPKEKFPHTYYTINIDACKSLADKLNDIQRVFLN